MIVAGSGGWADVLASAYNLKASAIDESSMSDMIQGTTCFLFISLNIKLSSM